MARLMSEPGRPDDVADRPNTVNIGAAVFVGDHVPALHRDAERLEADILGIGNDAHFDDDVAEITLLARSALAGQSFDDTATGLSVHPFCSFPFFVFYSLFFVFLFNLPSFL